MNVSHKRKLKRGRRRRKRKRERKRKRKQNVLKARFAGAKKLLFGKKGVKMGEAMGSSQEFLL